MVIDRVESLGQVDEYRCAQYCLLLMAVMILFRTLSVAEVHP